MIIFGHTSNGLDARSSLDITSFRRPWSGENQWQSGAKTGLDVYGVENGLDEECHVVNPTGRDMTRQFDHKDVAVMANETNQTHTIDSPPAFAQAELLETRFAPSVYSSPP